MRCPKCGSEDNKVRDVRSYPEYVRRRRKCDSCGFSFSTDEVYTTLKKKPELLTVQCTVCGKDVLTKSRKTKYCEDCKKDVKVYRDAARDRTSKKRKSRSALVDLNGEAREKKLSYGQLQALKFLKNQKSVLDGDGE